MEELITHAACVSITIVVFTLGAALFIVAGHALFIFVEICTRLTRRLIKRLDKCFEEDSR